MNMSMNMNSRKALAFDAAAGAQDFSNRRSLT